MNDLSQAFASSLFFRILLPGLVLAIGIHPLLAPGPRAAALGAIYPGGSGALFLAEVTTFGLIAYAASTPVYHIAQGLILRGLTAPARVINRWRFNRKYKAFAAAYAGNTYDQVDPSTAETLQQLFVYLSDYPIERDEDGVARFVLRHATRVGNITATYERYPDTRYGINAEAHWDHFLFLVPAETRKELDGIQATAIGTLLSSAAGWGVFSVFVLLGVLRVLNHVFAWSIGAAPLPDGSILALIGYGLGAAILFNYLTRVVHREYARAFRACFDIHVASFVTWIRGHSAPLSRADIAAADSFRAYASALDQTIAS